MATSTLDLDLDSPLPEAIALDGYKHVRITAWRAGAPVGTLRLARHNERSPLAAEVAQELEALGTVEDGHPLGAGRQLPSLSVVICTRDGTDRLRVALGALRAQTVRHFELVVVDNAPTNGRTRQLVRELWPEARYVVEPVPGLPRARNRGVRKTSGEVIAFTDDDCRPVAGWIEALGQSFAANAQIGCVTGPILPLELTTPAQETMEGRGGFNRGFRRTLHTLEAETCRVWPVRAWRFGAGGSFALRRTCFEALGGFDQALWRSEDLDIFYRTLRIGYALAFEPGAAVRHRHLPAWRQFRRRMFHWEWGIPGPSLQDTAHRRRAVCAPRTCGTP